MALWLEPIRRRLPPDLSLQDAASLQEAITREALRRFEAFLSGVKLYQKTQTEPVRAGQSAPVLLEFGTMRLLDYAPDSAGAVVLVVPSLVNRFDILDLEPDHSFLRFLVAQGLRPLVVDWGRLGEAEKSFDLEAYQRERLIPALETACALSADGRASLLGYCMGGVMALALAAQRSEKVRALALLATPWDFSCGVGGVPGAATPWGGWFLQQALAAEGAIEKAGFVPAEMLQQLFVLFQPLQVLEKFSRFGVQEDETLADDVGRGDAPVGDEQACGAQARGAQARGAQARRFVLTEDWLNDGVPLAAPTARQVLHEWYAENQLVKGSWRLGGRTVDPALLDIPSYVAVAERDRIVPAASSEALIARLARPVLHKAPLGHIGLMASREAQDLVWRPLAQWLLEVS